jgi:hypothetical protein
MNTRYNTDHKGQGFSPYPGIFYERILAIAKRVALPFGFSLGTVVKSSVHYGLRQEAWFIRVGDPEAKCNTTGKPMPWWGRKWYISPHMTDGEIVQTIFLACRVAVEHELREQFKYKGAAIFDPHYNLDILVAARQNGEATEKREHV